MGVEIIRFSDQEILNNIEGVYEMIQRVIEKRRGNPPHLNPLPQGRGGMEKRKLPSIFPKEG
jgi:hypothetical protein